MVYNIIAKCSEHMEILLYAPNMRSFFHPVDAEVGLSFKAAFRRLLVDHVVEYIKKMKSSAITNFKVNHAVTISEFVRFIAKSWTLCQNQCFKIMGQDLYSGVISNIES